MNFNKIMATQLKRIDDTPAQTETTYPQYCTNFQTKLNYYAKNYN